MTTTIAASTDPEAHSINLENTPIPLTIEPANAQDRCHVCGYRYEQGEWRLLVADGPKVRHEQLHMCKTCATFIGSAVRQFPTGRAPWVDYS